MTHLAEFNILRNRHKHQCSNACNVVINNQTNNQCKHQRTRSVASSDRKPVARPITKTPSAPTYPPIVERS